MVCKHVLIKGPRIVGVFFRVYIKEKAGKLGITGWVRNNTNNSVEAIFEGDSEKVNELIKWCKIGPENAVISSVDSYNLDDKDTFKKFIIKY